MATGAIRSTSLPGALLFLAYLAAFSLEGCATGAPAPPPIVVSALALPAVGRVIPTFIEVRTPQTGSNEPQAETDPESVCALNDQGFCVAPLGLDQAAEAAGGIDKLVNGIVNESASAAVGRSMGSIAESSVEAGAEATRGIPASAGPGGGQAAGGLFVAIVAAGTAVALARGAYLAVSPEARMRDELNAFSLGGDWYANKQGGFVYFPAETYLRIRVIARFRDRASRFWLEWPQGSRKSFKFQRLGNDQPTEPASPQTSAPPGSSNSPAGD